MSVLQLIDFTYWQEFCFSINMNVAITKKSIKNAAPFALAAAAVVSAGVWVWQKTRVSLPDGAIPVSNFDVDRYLGKWYEVARFDYRFEKGLKNVTAHYSKNEDGSIKVVNGGEDIFSGEWKESTGKVKFISDEHTGRLRVSFFGPFYAAYNIIALDDNYHYALIAGNDLDYLWLLSRKPSMPEDIKTDYLKKATALGYNTDKLIWTEQSSG